MGFAGLGPGISRAADFERLEVQFSSFDPHFRRFTGGVRNLLAACAGTHPGALLHRILALDGVVSAAALDHYRVDGFARSTVRADQSSLENGFPSSRRPEYLYLLGHHVGSSVIAHGPRNDDPFDSCLSADGRFVRRKRAFVRFGAVKDTQADRPAALMAVGVGGDDRGAYP